MFRVKYEDEERHNSVTNIWEKFSVEDELIDADTFTIDKPLVVFTKEQKVVVAFHDYKIDRIEEYDE